MSDSRPPRSALFGLLLLSAATLLLEVALTRVLSVAFWYHVAFMVVSTALFGFGFAGVVLSLRKEAQQIPARLVALAAAATPWAFAGGYALFNRIPVEPFSLGTDRSQWLWLPLGYLAIAAPFFLAGIAVSGLLTRHARQIHRLYLFDLIGAGAGSLLVLSLLPIAGGSGTVIAAAALAAAGAALVSLEASNGLAVGCAASTLALAALVPWAESLIPLRISRDKIGGGGVPMQRILEDKRANLFTAWNSLSRTDVIEARGGRLVLIDAGTAVTRLAHPEGPVASLAATEDEEGFFVRARPQAQVLVVGSGGGREVLLSLRNGARKVVAVEINPAINALVKQRMADYSGRLYDDPRVEVITDEARSFLRRSTERFELISCPHTISNAAMASGSLSLAESYLLTREAFADYLDHLAPDGVLFMTRPEAHLPRLFATARAALEVRGETDLANRVIAYKQKGSSAFYAGFALSRRPLPQALLADFAKNLEKAGLEPLYLPGMVAAEPYRSLASAARIEEVPLPFAAILEPATDDQPFFNQRVPLSKLSWSDLSGAFSRGNQARMALEDRPIAEAALVVLLAQAALLALFFIVVPLLVFRRRSLAGGGQLRTLLAFAGLGFGYIVVEVGFIQRLSLYLGKPALVFAVALGTLLVSSGIGSAISPRLFASRPPWMACAAAGLAALAMGIVARPILAATLALPEPARVLVAVAVLVPAGLAMGLPFPTLVRQLEATRPERIPWAWGVNGFASVVGSVGAVVLGMAFGYTAVFAAGVLAYAAAAMATWGRIS